MSEFLIQPKNPKGVGSIEHYFHFLFDLVFPLFMKLHSRQIHDAAILYIERKGYFVDLLQCIFSHDIRVVSNAGELANLTPLPLAGCDTSAVQIDYGDIEAFRQHVIQRLEVPRREKQHILLIERGDPDPYFTSPDCDYTDSGSARRTIRNHLQLRSTLERRFGSQLMNVRLEEIPFEQQVDYFHNAKAVIGQHGAGLANCIWMEPGSQVFELTHTGFSHFLNLSLASRLDHYFFPMFGPKSKVNSHMLAKFLQYRLLPEV